MLKLLSPIDYCQGIRRERGTLLLVLFFVKHEVYADIDVPLKYHDERLTLDQWSPTYFRLRAALPSSATFLSRHGFRKFIITTNTSWPKERLASLTAALILI